jgi:glycosyltransferase involved in cell wall biosynthesis
VHALLDLTHTSHTRARTGIQRVARALYQHLAGSAEAVTHDPYLGVWRPLEPWEHANLANSQGGAKRKAQWPAAVRWRGRVLRLLGRHRLRELRGHFDGLIVPEIFSPRVARDFPDVSKHVRGPRVALFLDAIPLRFPELTPPGTVARFPAYLRELLMFDGIAAISAESRDSLNEYWDWLGVTRRPLVHALPLGVDPKPTRSAQPSTPRFGSENSKPVVLCVGTLEGRKNHLQLFEACERLWTSGASFSLCVIGHVNQETGGTALARLRELQAAGRPLIYNGPATDEEIDEAYAVCTFTVYPSLAEGFGLPVIESLARGKPCIASGHGALGEITHGGGCVPLEQLDAEAIGAAIATLLNSPTRVGQLSDAARARQFKSWADYSQELIAWMQSLPPR